MSLLQGCSELQETARLVEELMGLRVAPRPSAPAPAAPAAPAAAPAFPASQSDASAAPVIELEEEAMPQFAYRGDKLQYILSSLCKRGGFIGAVVADHKGLPLADFNSPVGGDILAAFTSVLGNALERGAMLLGESGADIISMDINYTDKVVLRRFAVRGEPYFLMGVCAQPVEERTELELSIEQLIAVLSE